MGSLVSGRCVGSANRFSLADSVEWVSWARLSRSARSVCSDRVESVGRSGEVNRFIRVVSAGSDQSGQVNQFGRSVGSYGSVGRERTISSLESRKAGSGRSLRVGQGYSVNRFAWVWSVLQVNRIGRFTSLVAIWSGCSGASGRAGVIVVGRAKFF